MKYSIIAIVAEKMDHLFAGIKEFPTQQVILVSQSASLDKAEGVREELKKFSIPVKVFEIGSNIWLESFRAVAEIKQFTDENSLLINVATSDCGMSCAMTSAAFVNGIRAFTVQKGEVVFLPVLKFSYYKMLTDKKLEILKILQSSPECCASLDELGKKLGMSMPLVSYHINGTLKADGLKKLGLVDTAEAKGRVSVKLSTLGKLLVKGYIS